MTGEAARDVVRDAALAAFSAPEAALVAVWVRLRDHGAMEFARAASRHDGPRHARVRSGLLDELGDFESGPVAQDCRVEDALAVLEALDEYCHETSSLWGRDAPLARVECAGSQWIVRARPRNAVVPCDHQATILQGWARRHWVHPARHQGIEIRAAWSRPALRRDLKVCAERGFVRAMVVAFDDACALDCDLGDAGMFFRGIRDPDVRGTAIEAALEGAAAAEADVVVLPELTVTEALRDRAAAWLRRRTDHNLRLVALGSFHVERNGLRRAVGWVLDRYGDVVIEHTKLQPMGFRRSDGGTQVERTEDVLGANWVHAAGTPVGMLAAPLCLDFCQAMTPIGTLWQEIGLELALVPSMSGATTLGAHSRRADDLCLAHGTVSVVAVQPATEGDAHAAVFRAPGLAEQDMSLPGAAAGSGGPRMRMVTIPLGPRRGAQP